MEKFMKKVFSIRNFYVFIFCVMLIETLEISGVDVTKFDIGKNIEKKSKVSYENTKLDNGVEENDTLPYESTKLDNSTLKSAVKKSEKKSALSYDRDKLEDVVYLSDIPYKEAQIGWRTIGLDKTVDNAALTMRIDGSVVTLTKGIWAHATSTVIYDISNYKDYAYFTTYYGLNTTNNNVGNGVKFYIYTSVDGENWTLKTDDNPVALKSGNDAVYARINIKDANYIKLYADDNGSNASDHAVWGDAKLVKEGYNKNVMTTVSEYDEIIKSKYQSGVVSDDLKLTLLQREFIKNIGQYRLRLFLGKDSKHVETLEWFLNNEEALRLWTVGGKPNGTYENSLAVLSNLYHTYKDDLSNENTTSSGIKYKDLYLKMMISLSLTHSSSVGLWIGGNQYSNAVERYKIYKEMYLNNQLSSNRMFENYTVEEMRWLMHVNIDDEEIKWLRDYSLRRYPDVTQRFSPYSYVRYTTGYSYYRPQYYSKENYDKWNQKYNLANYNITYQAGKPKLWIVFEEGAVCGGISKTAANLYGVWGIPASVVGQPGHAAYIYYYDVGGKGAWQLSYNVAATGWANTSGYTRMPNDWGNLNSGVVTNGANIKSASYFFLAQEAQNEYDKYEQAKLITLLADVYKNDRTKLEKIYRDTLEVEKINWDAWLGLVNLYITDPTKTDEDLVNLAEEISSNLIYHPLPMYDLTRRIGTKIKSSEYKGRLMIIQNRTLKQAQKATSANTLQYKEVPVVASALLGEINSEIATFSFTGANANKIVLSTQLQSTQVNWEYSLDGGNTWKDVHESSVTLSAAEVASITDKNDVKVHINGLPLNNQNIYTIDITKRSFPTNLITVNDEEDRLLGVTRDMEWTLDPNEGWNSFATTNPLFSGHKRVYVRVIAAGTQIASDPVYYTFNENNSNDEAWYIQSKNLKVVEVNASGAGSWNNILDGNVNTYFRTKAGLMPAYVTVQLDQPRYISGLDYVPDKSAKQFGAIPYGRARNVNIYVSMDNENWELAATKNNIGDNDNLKHIDLTSPKKALYVKFECTAAYDGPSNLLAISVLKLYENVLVSDTPRADINYSIVDTTNKDVEAELVNLIRPITVTNNDGKLTHTFTENGEFTFEFVDEDGNKGTATAKVTWIDKTAPTVDVTFNTTQITNNEVVATLKFSKDDITILSKDIQIAENPDKSKTITFEENTSFDLEFQDKLGNIGKKHITVDWIDTITPTAEFEFNTTNITDKEVVATLKPSEEVTILNNDGKDTYTFTENGSFTFEFVDKAGNVGEATVTVDWIAKLPQYKIRYSTKELTKDDVKIALDLEDGYQIVNNNASNEYLFTENGTFEFQYKDKNGNVGIIPITVDWIDKENPTAEFEFNTKTWTNKDVTVTLKPNEEVKILNNGGKDTYTFTENGSFTFEFVDKVGNKGSAIAKVSWIDKKVPTATIEYSTTSPTDQNVVATLKPSEEVTVLNGNITYTFTENAEYTFEFVDKAGNKGYATAKVSWINKSSKDDLDVKNDSSTKKESQNNVNSKNDFKENTNKYNDKKAVKNEESMTLEATYIDIINGNIKVKIPNSIFNQYKELSLDYKKLTLSDSQQYRYGKDSDIYELSLKTKDNCNVDLSNIIIQKIVKLDSNKKFDKLYVVRSDGSTVELNSEVNENNELVFEDEGLGQYIISYKKENSNMNKATKTKKQDVRYYIIGASLISLFTLIFALVFKLRKRQ